jgi:hypothetical protein
MGPIRTADLQASRLRQDGVCYYLTISQPSTETKKLTFTPNLIRSSDWPWHTELSQDVGLVDELTLRDQGFTKNRRIDDRKQKQRTQKQPSNKLTLRNNESQIHVFQVHMRLTYFF